MSSFTYNKQATSTTKHSSRNNVLPFLLASITLVILGLVSDVRADECHLTPVIHVLQYPGCIPKPIPSFACTGKCTSYVQEEEIATHFR
ncbi:hypothetical protein OUZ56_022454 [Daphnia magna]|uniref:DAN domain-containing protein n=1 Tax=Daphnia magna TaxID=35525 RepID=A0ABR0AWF8_9CRUS|nr:hypothetical protein OUZ56_022454 [Daphnia magna]